MKFKVGDRIKSESSDRVGHAYATIERAKPSEGVYWVSWDHHQGQHDYKAEDVDNVWEHACPVIINTQGPMTITLPIPNNGATHYTIYRQQNSEKLTGCDHKWADYHGFSEDYQFCEKCDEKRKYAN